MDIDSNRIRVMSPGLNKDSCTKYSGSESKETGMFLEFTPADRYASTRV
jgi:hypothetical protein